MKKILPLLLLVLVASLCDAQKDVPSPPPAPDAPMPPSEITEATYDAGAIEKIPQFPGGEAKLYEYLAKNLKYPEMEKEADVEGRVFVEFFIEKDGTITNAKIKRGVQGGPGLDKEALRVVRSMPKWTPGEQGGKAVRSQMVLPVAFSLK